MKAPADRIKEIDTELHVLEARRQGLLVEMRSGGVFVQAPKPCQCETFLLRRSMNGLLRMNGVRKPFGQPRNIVGPQVRRMRCKAGLSQPALAAQCQRIGWDVGRDAIAKIEGRTRWVADSELIHLAKALSSPLTDLFMSASQRAAKGK